MTHCIRVGVAAPLPASSQTMHGADLDAWLQESQTGTCDDS